MNNKPTNLNEFLMPSSSSSSNTYNDPVKQQKHLIDQQQNNNILLNTAFASILNQNVMNTNNKTMTNTL